MWPLSAIALFTASLPGMVFTSGGLRAVSLLAALAALARWLYTRMGSWVVRRHGARQLYFEEAPWLYELVAHLSIAAGIPCPRLYVVRRQQPNALALGTGARTSSIILTSAALRQLTEAELCALIAHELAHIAHGHTRRATLVAALAAVMMRMGERRGRSPGRPTQGAAPLRRPAARRTVSPRLLARLHRLGTPPERDLAADRAAARILGDALGLAALLARLKECAPWGAPVSLLDAGTPYTAPSGDGTSGTSLDERIHQLERMAAEEQARCAKAVLRRTTRRGSRFYPRAQHRKHRALTSGSRRPPRADREPPRCGAGRGEHWAAASRSYPPP